MEETASNDYLLATNAAYDFKGSVEQLTDVLNLQNFITNNAAVSMQDMADATSQAASIASQYGVEVDELSALIGVAVSKTRKSGAEVGTALKSIFANLQDTTSKPIVSAFNAVGVSMTKIVNGAETLKTPIELLEELSAAYNSLPEGDARRANILTDIGTKYHSNILSSILGDYESLNEMLDLYHSNLADGSAYKEAMKSANNWEGSLNKLSNSFTDLVQNFIDSDEVIGAINLVNGLVKGIDKLTESVGILGTVGVGAMGFLGAKGHGLTNCVTISYHSLRALPYKII
jgi:TP901 family phage tail tape measure protein